MNTTLPKLADAELIPTRNYLQDVAKIMGKLQQLFIPPHPKDWQRGLGLVEEGLITQIFTLNGTPTTVTLDFRQAQLTVSNGPSWSLDVSAQEVLSYLAEWLVENNITRPLPQPEIVTDKPVFHQEQATKLAITFSWINEVFEAFKKTMPAASFSPVLLYPHHFDISLVQFFGKDLNNGQLGFGFSTGDETITEPYFYITAYPQPHDFQKFSLLPPAYWQTQGFSGAVLKYHDIVITDNPKALVLQFLDTVAKHVKG